MSILRDLMTCSDGVSHDLGRYSWVGSFAAVLSLTGWNCYKGSPPSIGELAAALGGVAAAHAGALFIKSSTEPKPDSTT